MRTLAIDCSTEACSIALFSESECIAHDHRILGRGHAEHLVPMISALPGKGKAERILVARGPGSFTGIRIGIATARALGLAWKAEVLGYPTLALVAAMARAENEDCSVDVAMTGGHGEWFLQSFGGDGLPATESASLNPQDAARTATSHIVAGTQAQALVDLRGTGLPLPLHPDARHALALADDLLSLAVTPIYGRPPDAAPAKQVKRR